MQKKVGKRGPATSSLLAWLGAGFPVLAVCAAVAGILGGALGAYLSFSADLPAIPDLRAYRPKTVSTFYADDGTVIGIFYKEKRFPIPIDSMPTHVVEAFLAAEDARFFHHPGVDWVGVVRAAIKNLGAGSFSQGGSTITQQVTRNFMLTKEKRVSRKIREAILAFRLEKTLSKKEILELYLNEIYLGRGAYGVEAAARTYFGKNTSDLNVGESAFLAGLVANPGRGSSNGSLDHAFRRQDFVLERMVVNGFISNEQRKQARAEPPKFRENLPNPYQRAPYFTEAVRKYITEKYGENRLYNEGLQVWTTCDLTLQRTAEEALLKGAEAWERRQGRPAGLLDRLKAAEAKVFLKDQADSEYKVGDVIPALVIQNHVDRKRKKGKEKKAVNQDCTLALQGDIRFRMELQGTIPYRANDVVLFRVAGIQDGNLSLEQQLLPPIEGALVSIENRTGYVRTVAGGLSFDRSSFNRATQAMRQPGSAFKPFVYAAALQWGGYGPETLILDEPIAVAVSQREAEWIPMNSDGKFVGPVSVRHALAQSRNIAAVKVIMDVGVDRTVRMAHDMGIRSPLRKNLSLCLGASEVTPLELTAAYTVFPNMGVRMDPVLVKKVVDRFGTVLEDNTTTPLNVAEIAVSSSPADFVDPYGQIPPPFEEQGYETGYPHADQPAWGQRHLPEGTPIASPPAESRPAPSSGASSSSASSSECAVLSPQTAYLMTSLLHETCVSGTAASVARMGRKDLAGKTGTTDDCTDAWFVGFSPEYTTGVWLGFDTKTSLGKKEYGNTAALPVWKSFMKEALRNSRTVGYPVPPGVAFRTADGSPLPKDPARLLESNPAMYPGPEAKPVCSVDMAAVPAAFQGEFPGGDAYAPYAYPPSQNWQAATDGWVAPGMGSYQDAYGYNPMSGIPGGYGHQSSTYPGTIRVLSPTGQSLGQAYYQVDKRGKISLYGLDAAPHPTFGERQPPSFDSPPRRDEREERYGRQDKDPERADSQRHASDSVMPMVGRFLQHLPEFIAPFIQGGRSQ